VAVRRMHTYTCDSMPRPLHLSSFHLVSSPFLLPAPSLSPQAHYVYPSCELQWHFTAATNVVRYSFPSLPWILSPSSSFLSFLAPPIRTDFADPEGWACRVTGQPQRRFVSRICRKSYALRTSSIPNRPGRSYRSNSTLRRPITCLLSLHTHSDTTIALSAVYPSHTSQSMATHRHRCNV
jgi:hypothetical protein